MKILKKWQNSANYWQVMVSVCALMVLIVLGFCSSSKSIYIAPVCNALGISRSAFAINDCLRYISTAVVNIFFGTLIAKFGSKKLILAGFVSLIVSMLIYSQSTNVFGFCMGGMLLGVGLAWTTTTMVGSVVDKWCQKNKGTIMGVILATNGIGATIAVQILTPVIYETQNPFGYRKAYILVSAILLVVAVIVMVFFKDKPDNDECFEKNAVIQPNDIPHRSGKSFAIPQKAYFYAALVCIFFTGMILQSINGIVAPMLGDLGFESSYVATILSVSSLILALSKFTTGFMCDRMGVKKTSLSCFVMALISMILLFNANPSTIGKLIAMVYAVLSSFALPLETIMLPIYAKEFSDKDNFNKILGVFVSVNTAGYAVGAPVANLCYDILGSYNVVLYISCALIVLDAVVMHMAISKANKDKNLCTIG